MSPSPTVVTHDAAAHRFQIVDEPSAFLQYALTDQLIRLIHTEVPSQVRGRGYASTLARAALEYAAAHTSELNRSARSCAAILHVVPSTTMLSNQQALKTWIAP